MTSNVELKLAGRYNMVVRDAKTLAVKRESGWFDNLITNIGLNRIGFGGIANYCRVGSGSTPPTVSDAALQSLVGSTGNTYSIVDGNAASAPYYGWSRRTYRFPAGVAAGNLSEVGVGWEPESGGGKPVFSRALIRDTDGNPTTITVLSDEVLDVTYELRNYAPTADVTFNVTIAGVVYACVLRASTVTTNWATRYLFDYGLITPVIAFTAVPYTGTIGDVTQAPTGSGLGSASMAVQPYSNNSLELTFVASWALDQANDAGGIGAFVLNRTYETLGCYQVSFNPKIPKDNTKVLSITFKVSWARKS